MLTVRDVGAEEWPLWRAVRLRSLSEAPEAFASSVREWTHQNDHEDRWVARMDAADSCLVAEVDGVVVGMVALDPEPGGCQLVSMFVGAEARRTGAGTALVRAVVDRAAGRPLRLRVMPDNAAAIAFYGRVGFVLDGAPPDADGCLAMTHQG